MPLDPSPLRPTDRVRRATSQTSCELGAERVLLNVESGRYYGLDPVGSRIWDLLVEERSVAQLQAILLEEYDVDPPTCGRELRELLVRLRGAGLVHIEVGDGSAP